MQVVNGDLESRFRVVITDKADTRDPDSRSENQQGLYHSSDGALRYHSYIIGESQYPTFISNLGQRIQ